MNDCASCTRIQLPVKALCIPNLNACCSVLCLVALYLRCCCYPSCSARHLTVFNGCSGAYSSASGAVFDESYRLLHVDSDRLHAVCASNAGMLTHNCDCLHAVYALYAGLVMHDSDPLHAVSASNAWSFIQSLTMV